MLFTRDRKTTVLQKTLDQDQRDLKSTDGSTPDGEPCCSTRTGLRQACSMFGRPRQLDQDQLFQSDPKK